MTGGCQCGRIRYAVEVHDDEAYLCHCRMCQRATGGFAAAFKEVPRVAVRWISEPDRYRSSPIAERGFCKVCGTPLTYEGDGSSHMDLTIGSFDDPARFRPAAHAGIESRHDAWLDTRGLPETRTDQLPHIVNKWIAAVGKLPD
jgi:hypothetical protein